MASLGAAECAVARIKSTGGKVCMLTKRILAWRCIKFSSSCGISAGLTKVLLSAANACDCAAMLALSTQAMSEKQQILTDFKEHVKNFRDALEENGRLELNAANRKAIDEIKPGLDNYIASSEELINTIFSADSANKNVAVAALKSKFLIAFEAEYLPIHEAHQTH